MSIGDLAAASGVSVRSLRYYEDQGLLTSDRSGGGQRRYDPGAVDRVRWIRHLFGAGLTSRTLRELLPCVHDGIVTADMVDSMRAVHRDLTSQIAELQQTVRRLDDVLAAIPELSEASA